MSDTLVGSQVATKAATAMGSAVDAALANIFTTLTLHDKCDRCLQTAVSQVLIAGTDLLLLCNHHFRTHRDAFVAKGYLYQFNGDQETQFTVSEKPQAVQRDAGSAVL